MIELDIVNNNETPNLATLYRLASTGSSSSINCGKWQLFWQQFVIYVIMGPCTGETVKSSLIRCFTITYNVQLYHLRPLRRLYYEYKIVISLP